LVITCLLVLFVYLFLYRGDEEEIPILDLLPVLFIPYLYKYSHNPRMGALYHTVLGQTGQCACVCMSCFQLDKHPAHPSTAGPLSLSILSYSTSIAMAEHGTTRLYHIPNTQKNKNKEEKSNNAHSALRPYDRWRGIAIAISIMPIMPITNSTRVIHTISRTVHKVASFAFGDPSQETIQYNMATIQHDTRDIHPATHLIPSHASTLPGVLTKSKRCQTGQVLYATSTPARYHPIPSHPIPSHNPTLTSAEIPLATQNFNLQRRRKERRKKNSPMRIRHRYTT